ncbi:hypothetical protein F5983_33800 [Streptomyces arboris]|uniref:Uncharacterized protein n=1 Tax=Streptomyces arboris TaxID=2600619 RepID=A0A5N5ECB5_9ACTN|nr:hypothetical protein F5983_33800 [Streptomyces arboris]
MGPAPHAHGDSPRGTHIQSTLPVCSSRPRGWSRQLHVLRRAGCLLPAPAGMVPARPRTRSSP